MSSVIIQSDFTIMLEVSDVHFNEVKSDLIKFSEIELSSDSVFIFKLTKLSIWNAVAQEVTEDYIFNKLREHSKYPVPDNILIEIDRWFSIYGLIELDTHSDSHYLLKVKDSETKEKIKNLKRVCMFLDKETEDGFLVKYNHRGEIKSLLMREDYPVHDNIGFTKGNPLEFKILEKIRGTDIPITIRKYQEEAPKAVYDAGNGTVILPCGSGKTIVGVRFMELCQTDTLIVTNSEASAKQWKKTLLAFTSLEEKDVAIYSKDNKEIKRVTIVTYSMISYRYKDEFIHYIKFAKVNWGCLVLDEVHLMPANMFRIVASLQSVKRLALTATFVREDGREIDIFSLIGPKRYDKPWKDLEELGFIASVDLKLIKTNMTEYDRKKYSEAETVQQKFEIAATSKNKSEILRRILKKHKGATVLVIGHFTSHLIKLSKEFNAPVVYGDVPTDEREKYYEEMRERKRDLLFASKVANAALDIPNISVVVQISFQYGSRNEEAQRVGRCTRPKEEQAYFYTIVCKDTKEEDYNFNRQLFLTNEGYVYESTEMAV
jgi:DNA excision repair protein ERCC-3